MHAVLCGPCVPQWQAHTTHRWRFTVHNRTCMSASRRSRPTPRMGSRAARSLLGPLVDGYRDLEPVKQQYDRPAVRLVLNRLQQDRMQMHVHDAWCPAILCLWHSLLHQASKRWTTRVSLTCTATMTRCTPNLKQQHCCSCCRQQIW